MRWWWVVLRRTAALAALATCAAAAAAPRTICTITINSADERDALQRLLPAEQYRFVELVQRGRPDWLASACRRGVRCDALVISGHFDDGTEFYTDRFDDREFLAMHELQAASCSAACEGLFAPLQEVYLFGCNTLKAEPRYVGTGEARRSLMRAGHPAAEAERIAAALDERYGQSNRDRLRQVFKGVPVLYGFASAAPLGRTAGPLLERYLLAAPPLEVGGGRPSAGLLGLFGPTSMVAVTGLGDSEPQAAFRRELCGLADPAPSLSTKVEHLHRLLQRDAAELRPWLEHFEHFMGTLTLARRLEPAVAAARDVIRRDQAARSRYLAFVRDGDRADIQLRMLALARSLAWLDADQERDELAQLLAQRMAGNRLGRHEVDQVCAAYPEADPELARRLRADGAARAEQPAHAAVLACLGDAAAHGRALQALTAGGDDEVAIGQAYLRRRPLADSADARTLASGIVRMNVPALQVRALETLARQRLADGESLRSVVKLFASTRSIEVQRAVAALLIRADHRLLERSELMRLLRQSRIRSREGGDVIDALIRVLQSG